MLLEAWQEECMKSILESVLLQTDILWPGMCLMTFTVLANVMYIWALGSGRVLPSSKYTAVMQYLSYEIPKPAISYVSRQYPMSPIHLGSQMLSQLICSLVTH